MSFIGQADVNIDKKSRVAIPAKFRMVLEKKNLGPGWVCTPLDGTLCLFPEATFERLSDPWGNTLILDKDIRKILDTIFGSAEKIYMDSAGRVTLFKKHLAQTGLAGEVTVTGANTHLVIRDRATWEAEEAERHAQLPDLIAKWNAHQAQGQPPLAQG